MNKKKQFSSHVSLLAPEELCFCAQRVRTNHLLQRIILQKLFLIEKAMDISWLTV